MSHHIFSSFLHQTLQSTEFSEIGCEQSPIPFEMNVAWVGTNMNERRRNMTTHLKFCLTGSIIDILSFVACVATCAYFRSFISVYLLIVRKVLLMYCMCRFQIQCKNSLGFAIAKRFHIYERESERERGENTKTKKNSYTHLFRCVLHIGNYYPIRSPTTATTYNFHLKLPIKYILLICCTHIPQYVYSLTSAHF